MHRETKKAPGVPGLSKQMSIRKRLGIKCVKRPDPPLSVGGTGLATTHPPLPERHGRDDP
jgi:hypothetical protein